MKRLCLMPLCALLASCSAAGGTLSDSPDSGRFTSDDPSLPESIETEQGTSGGSLNVSPDSEGSWDESSPDDSAVSSDSRHYIGSDGSKWVATLDPMEADYVIETCDNFNVPESLTLHFHKDRSCVWKWDEEDGANGEYAVDYEATISETENGYCTDVAELYFYERDISLRPNDWIARVLHMLWGYDLKTYEIGTGSSGFACAAGEDGWPDLSNCWEYREHLTFRRVI